MSIEDCLIGACRRCAVSSEVSTWSRNLRIRAQLLKACDAMVFDNNFKKAHSIIVRQVDILLDKAADAEAQNRETLLTWREALITLQRALWRYQSMLHEITESTGRVDTLLKRLP